MISQNYDRYQGVLSSVVSKIFDENVQETEKLHQSNNQLMNYTKQSLECLQNAKSYRLLKIKFMELINWEK